MSMGYPDGEALVAQEAELEARRKSRQAAWDRRGRMRRSKWVRENPELAAAFRVLIESGLERHKLDDLYLMMRIVVREDEARSERVPRA